MIMYQPEGDEFPSTSSEPPRRDPVVAQPHDDEFLSSETFSNGQAPPVNANNANAEQPPRAGAQPFSTSNHIPLPPRQGADTEQTRYSTDREVTPYHIGKVVQKASIQFNEDLMRGADFTLEDRRRITGMTRKQKCAQIIDIWQRRGTTPKILFDLKVLLTRAGDPDNKYEALIRDVLRTRVS